MSSFFQRFKYSYDKFLHKINFNEYYQKLLTPYNIRLIAYAFIITRIYKIYQLYFEEIILLDVLHTIQKKQIFHIKDLEKKNKLNGEKLLRDYNLPAEDYYAILQEAKTLKL